MKESEQSANRPVSAMSTDDIRYLSSMFIEEPEPFANFHTLWNCFVGEAPSPDEVLSFFEEVEDLGYYIKR